MVNDCAKRCKAKRNFSLIKAQKSVFVESLDQFRHLGVGEQVRNVFVMSLPLCDRPQGLTQHRISSH